jgi:hypothetical protein
MRRSITAILRWSRKSKRTNKARSGFTGRTSTTLTPAARSRATDSDLKNGRLPNESISALHGTPALRRPGQRGHELVHEPTRTPDVELGMNRGRRRIDIRNQCLHARFAVGQQAAGDARPSGACRPPRWPAGRCPAHPVPGCQAPRGWRPECRVPIRAPEVASQWRGASRSGPVGARRSGGTSPRPPPAQDHQQQPGQRTAIGVAPRKQPKGQPPTKRPREEGSAG